MTSRLPAAVIMPAVWTPVEDSDPEAVPTGSGVAG
jgi:hypothetical protein